MWQIAQIILSGMLHRLCKDIVTIIDKLLFRYRISMVHAEYTLRTVLLGGGEIEYNGFEYNYRVFKTLGHKHSSWSDTYIYDLQGRYIARLSHNY